MLFQVAAGGDVVAMELVHHQAEEVVAMAMVAMRRLELFDEPTDVILGGDVLTAGHPLLMETMVRLLAAAAPKAVARVVDVAPVVGAPLLGLDHTNAAPTTRTQLRAALAPPPAA